ncbi:MAG: cryptochrome/photolyase family protein [Prochlorococcus sp. SP3034]|nr:cryptochrome/photolyase family protein [Prochlorococcus sp. SP3034]
MNQISIVFPNQLFKDSPLIKLGFVILMIEDSLFFGNDKNYKLVNNINKLIFLKASMQCYQEHLEELGIKVIYGENQNNYTTSCYLKKYISSNCKIINIINPHDYLIMKRINKFAEINDININIHESPMFITESDLIKKFEDDDKKPLMARFYKDQRKSLNILVNSDNSPYGGKWSFDEFNRKKLPKNIEVPKIKNISKNKFIKNIEKKIFNSDLKYIGSSQYFFFPIKFKEVDNWLDDFLESRLNLFGDYEDAISKNQDFLWHSLLSPLLNSGLLTPKEVIHKTLIFAEENNIPLNSLEGFFRQIIGWREFVCLIYKKYGNTMRKQNFWNFENKPIPKSFYSGETGILPVDNVIKKILKFGYCHHIERLMIIGNFMLLCNIHPDQVYKWFMEMFIDSYDWVMVPNIYGMSQFSDGGIFSTKPYISSSNYIKKMSDYKNGEWCDIWDSLFWKFIKDNEHYFRKQYRLAMITRNLDKMNLAQLNKHLENAEKFLDNLN